MGMARYRDAALRERSVKELPVAALLAPQHPSFRVQSLQHIANFHKRQPGQTNRGASTPNDKLTDDEERAKCNRIGTAA